MKEAMPEATQPSDLGADLREALDATLVQRDSQTSSAAKNETSSNAESPAPKLAASDNAPAAPATASVTDLSFLPEHVRSEFTDVSPAAKEILRNGMMMRSDYTKKTQELANKTKVLEEQVEQFRNDAVLWRRLQNDKDAFKHLADYLSQRNSAPAQSAAEETEEEDLDYLDPAKMKAWRNKVKEEAKREALKALDEQYFAPMRKQNELGNLLKGKFIDEMGLDPQVVETAATMAGQHANKWKIDVNAENVIDLVSDFIEQAKSRTNKSAPEVRTTPFQAPEQTRAPEPRRMATPTPSMSGGVAPPTAPAFKRENRVPAKRDDYHAAVLDQLGKEWGQEVTESDLKSILNQALTGSE